ncbi:MAG: DoxX family protein, partial [Kiritimatiellales bacterium]|nr:DoxX family protein [Kiritimatiellales bacterium]
MMKRMQVNRWAITLLRVTIGWHFLWEGLSKHAIEEWTASGFLTHATGPFAGFYHWLVSSEGLMQFVDAANIYGLIAIGLALFLGFFLRTASVSGIVLLTLYYFAYPPFGATLMNSTEGNVFIVNRIFLEAMALLAILLVKDKGFGLYAVHFKVEPELEAQAAGSSRRASLANLFVLPLLGAIGWGAHRHRKKFGVDVMTGATIQVGAADLGELKGELPKGNLGEHEIGRLVLGGNLIGGWMHARDLRYVSSLAKAYNNERRIFETLQLAELAGINSINIGFKSNAVLRKYKDVTGSKIKVISQVAPEKDDNLVCINQAIDFGVDIIQIQGNWCDWLVRDGKIDAIAEMLDYIRSQNYVA